MISKKVCMVGAFSVGKTALIQRYVHSIFSDTYLSTIGVKISKKGVVVDDTPMNLLLWDLEGQDDYGEVNTYYLRGAMGVLIVADGMRSESLSTALALRDVVMDTVGPVPYLLLLNKSDLADLWEVPEAVITSLRDKGVNVVKTSAKTGENVEQAFLDLATAMLKY